jgi:hypothetical protein
MRKDKSEEPGPTIFAWCDQAARVDSYAATLAALADLALPGEGLSIVINSLVTRDGVNRHNISVEEAIAMMRAAFTTGTSSTTSVTVSPRAGDHLWLTFYCNGDELERRYPLGPLSISRGEWKDVVPARLTLAYGQGERDLAVEAAILAMQGQEDGEALLLALCAPDASGRVVTGTYTSAWPWGAPIEACATYHADAGAVARDLALSWIHLHDGDRMARIAGMSMEALHARVESAPLSAHVAVAPDVAHIFEHATLERADRLAMHIPHARVALPGDVALSREAVLAALSTSPGALLEALEASALPDDAWRAVEPRALETIETTKAGAPTHEVVVSTRKHVQFLERHAPYHVRRLPNGGVLLATHPYRTLWQLYADALFLLGITP